MASRLYRQPGSIILTLFFLTTCSMIFEIAAQDASVQEAAPIYKCNPGTFPTEILCSNGQLGLFCHEAPKCAVLAPNTATCSETWTPSCAATAYVGAIQFISITGNNVNNYLVQCCQHPGIIQANVIGVTNRFLGAYDSFVQAVTGNLLQVISNVYAAEKGTHIVQLTKIRCS